MMAELGSWGVGEVGEVGELLLNEPCFTLHNTSRCTNTERIDHRAFPPSLLLEACTFMREGKGVRRGLHPVFSAWSLCSNPEGGKVLAQEDCEKIRRPPHVKLLIVCCKFRQAPSYQRMSP